MRSHVRKLLELFVFQFQLSRIFKQPVFGFLFFSKVTRYLRKAYNLISTVVQRCDRNAAPKTRSIFAYSPAFMTCTTILFGFHNQLLGKFSLLVFRQIENAKVFPEYFCFLISLNMFCTFVPRLNYAIHIQQNN